MRLKICAVLLALAACGDRDRADADDAGAALGNAAVPAAPAAPRTAADGRQYVDMVAAADLYAIEAARLAIEKAGNADVRALAQTVLDDHEGAAEQLGAAARRAEPPLAVDPALDPAQENDLQALRAASGPAFDREYLMQQLRAHDQALGLVTHYAVNGDVESLRRHASAASDPIRRHLSRARDLVVQVP